MAPPPGTRPMRRGAGSPEGSGELAVGFGADGEVGPVVTVEAAGADVLRLRGVAAGVASLGLSLLLGAGGAVALEAGFLIAAGLGVTGLRLGAAAGEVGSGALLVLAVAATVADDLRGVLVGAILTGVDFAGESLGGEFGSLREVFLAARLRAGGGASPLVAGDGVWFFFGSLLVIRDRGWKVRPVAQRVRVGDVSRGTIRCCWRGGWRQNQASRRSSKSSATSKLVKTLRVSG